MQYTYANTKNVFLSGGVAPRTPYKHEQTSSARTHAKRAHARISVIRSRSINGTFVQILEIIQILVFNR